ncbi:MAG: EAL domain-containing protein [Actinobacteria bacterium]|nr:EAL domain-containing protein [Actinomycetota bacterium]
MKTLIPGSTLAALSPVGGRLTRRALAPWAFLVLVLVILGSATFGIGLLRHRADEARAEQLTLERLRSLANEQSTLEWQAIAAHGSAPALSRQIESRRGRIEQELDGLGQSGAEQLRRALSSYEDALGDELRLLAGGSDERALTLGERRVDPSFDSAVAALRRLSADRAARARGAGRRATVGALAILALALAALVAVFWAYQRTRRSLAGAEERALRESERWFRSLVLNASDLIVVVDRGGTIRYATASAERIVGVSPQELVGRKLVELVRTDDRRGLQSPEGTGGARTFERSIRHRDGSVLLVEWTQRPTDEGDGWILTGRDVSERKRFEQRLHHQAFHDSLTGLANRALFEDCVMRALSERGRGQLGVLFLDLDNFKLVNDSLGHAAGDELLRLVADRLRAGVRGGDTAARLGGDEFGVLLEDLSGPDAAAEVAERIFAVLEAPFEIESVEIDLTASIGIELCTAAETTLEEAMRNADLAMYEAKKSGGGHYRLFLPSMRDLTVGRLELIGQLRRAVERDELELYHQPIVTLADSRIVGVEALLRWRHPQLGLLSPTDFLRHAEEASLIVPLGRWVLEEACAALARWRAADSAGTSGVVMCVNISTKQLRESDLLADVTGALARAAIAPGDLVLEITESLLADDSEAVLGQLQRLRALGVRLAVDDFGTGFSGLGYLQRFPIDILKLDRSFVEHARPGAASLQLVRSIAQLGQNLHLEIVAEGVEEREQVVELQAMGVLRGQGFYFARPLGSEQMAAALASSTAAEAPSSIGDTAQGVGTSWAFEPVDGGRTA